MKYSISNFSLDTLIEGDSKLQVLVNDCLYSCKKLVSGIHSWMSEELSEDDVSESFTELAIHVDSLCQSLAADHAVDLVDGIEKLRISLEKLLECDLEDENSNFDELNSAVKESLVNLVRCLKSKMLFNEKDLIYTPPASGSSLKNDISTFEEEEDDKRDSIHLLSESKVEIPQEIITDLAPSNRNSILSPTLTDMNVRESVNLKSRSSSQTLLHVVVEPNRSEKLEYLSPTDTGSAASYESSFSPNSHFSALSPSTEQSLASSSAMSSAKRRKAKRQVPLSFSIEFNGTCKRIEYNLEPSLDAFTQFAKEKLSLPSGNYILELKDPEAAVFYNPDDFSEIKDLCHIKFRLNTLQSSKINDKLELMMSEMRNEILEKLSIVNISQTVKNEKLNALVQVDSALKQVEYEYLKETEHFSKQLSLMKGDIGDFLKNQNTGCSEKRCSLFVQRDKIMQRLAAEEKELSKLQIVIEGLKDDTIKRNCNPSKEIIKALTKKLENTGINVKEASEDLKNCKIEWKKLWEFELQQIVKEQESLEEKEVKMETDLDELKYLETTMANLTKISDLKVKRITGKKMKKAKNQADIDSHAVILQEISLMSTNSEYDLSATTYSPDGRIFQIEYAGKAVENSGTCIGLRVKDGVVLAMEKPIHTKLIVAGSNKRIGHVDLHCGIACSGLQADGRQLIQRARNDAQQYKDVFESPIPGKVLAEQVGQFMQAYTLYSSVRPFGASVLLAHKDKNGPQLFMIEPSGLYFGYYGCAIGKGKLAAKTEIEKLTLSTLTLKEAAKEAARIIYLVHDSAKDKEFELEMTWIGPESGDVHEAVPNDFLQECIAYAKTSLESAMLD